MPVTNFRYYESILDIYLYTTEDFSLIKGGYSFVILHHLSEWVLDSKIKIYLLDYQSRTQTFAFNHFKSLSFFG